MKPIIPLMEKMIDLNMLLKAKWSFLTDEEQQRLYDKVSAMVQTLARV